MLINGDQKLDRIDPYAKHVTNSTGNGVIYDVSAFDWQDDILSCRRTMNWSSMKCMSVHFLRMRMENREILILRWRNWGI